MALFKDMVLDMVSYDRVRKELMVKSARGGKSSKEARKKWQMRSDKRWENAVLLCNQVMK